MCASMRAGEGFSNTCIGNGIAKYGTIDPK